MFRFAVIASHQFCVCVDWQFACPENRLHCAGLDTM